MLRSFILLLLVDVAIVAGGLALFGGDRPARSSDATPEASPTGQRLLDEARALRAEAEALTLRLDAREPDRAARPSASDVPATPPSTPPGTLGDADLDRLEQAIKAVEARRTRARQRESLLFAVRHVYPAFTTDQQRDVAEAIGAYRDLLEGSLRPGGRGAQAGHAAGVAEMERRLAGVVPPAKAKEIVQRYAIQPGPPARPPAVSPPVRRR